MKGRTVSAIIMLSVAALLGFLIIPSYSSLQMYQTISTSGIVQQSQGGGVDLTPEKTIKWQDGTMTKIMVDDKGKVYLDGTEIKVFGFHLCPWHSWTSAQLDLVFDQLKSDGVRFIFLSDTPTPSEVTNFLNMAFPKLYARKFLVFFCCGNAFDLDQTKQMNRIKVITNWLNADATRQKYADMIFAFGWNWEMDQFGSYTASQLETYLSQMKPQVQREIDGSRIGNVALIGKLSSPGVAGRSNSIVKWSEIPTIDIYYRVTDHTLNYNWISGELSLFHTVMNDVGKGGMNVWYGEWGIWEEKNPYLEQNPEWLQYALSEAGYGDLSLLMIWSLYHMNPDGSWNGGWSAFDVNGNPLNWYVRIAPYFPKVS